MLEHDLIASDLGATFIHNSGHDSTSIDFFLYQNLYNDNIIQLEKLYITGNVSDHYPLLTVLHTCKRTVQKKSSENCVITRKIGWDKIDKGKYENNVKSYLESLTTEIDSFVDITKTLDNLNNILVKSADDAAPKIKKGKRRPKLQVMNDDIRIALSEKKAAFFKWKEMGRPNNPNNHYLKDKKRTTRLLRKECRLEIARRRINARQELILARTSDRNTFYEFIRKQRGQGVRPIDHLTVEGETYNNELIRERPFNLKGGLWFFSKKIF
jgi:hypothetical protein